MIVNNDNILQCRELQNSLYFNLVFQFLGFVHMGLMYHFVALPYNVKRYLTFS